MEREMDEGVPTDPIEQEAAALYDIAEIEQEVADEFAARNAAIDRLTKDKPGAVGNWFGEGAGRIKSPGFDVGGNAGGRVAMQFADEDETPGWIALHGRVRVQGLRFHRDATGMLIVSSDAAAPPVST